MSLFQYHIHSILTYVIVVVGGIGEVTHDDEVQQHVQRNSYPAIELLLLLPREYASILCGFLLVV